MIQKKKICKGVCGQLKYIFSKGMCQQCAAKGFKPIKQSTIKPTKRKPKENQDELNQFFDKHVSLLLYNPRSYESNSFIPNASRFHIAHLFPKRNHKSVATNDLNVAYLTWQEHFDFDKLLDSHRFEEIEKTFPKTWLLLKKVLPLVQERTKLLIALENYIVETKTR
jgi:hypothetical protein